MTIELWKSKLHNAQVLNLVFAALATVLAVALVANGFFRQNVAVHVVPINPTQEYWANAMGGDEYYKKSIAMAMLPWIANVTPLWAYVRVSRGGGRVREDQQSQSCVFCDG